MVVVHLQLTTSPCHTLEFFHFVFRSVYIPPSYVFLGSQGGLPLSSPLCEGTELGLRPCSSGPITHVRRMANLYRLPSSCLPRCLWARQCWCTDEEVERSLPRPSGIRGAPSLSRRRLRSSVSSRCFGSSSIYLRHPRRWNILTKYFGCILVRSHWSDSNLF